MKNEVVKCEGERATRPIPDFALDRHTRRGRQRRRGWDHFWEEGARLEMATEMEDPYRERTREIRTDAAEQGELDGL